jgi:hypothetical protein
VVSEKKGSSCFQLPPAANTLGRRQKLNHSLVNLDCPGALWLATKVPNWLDGANDSPAEREGLPQRLEFVGGATKTEIFSNFMCISQ